jgi:hypothetical protein
MAKNLNPQNIVPGDIVTLAPRKDGIPHRDGDDARWEVLSIGAQGLTFLHLVGAPANRTCGAAAYSLTKVGE